MTTAVTNYRSPALDPELRDAICAWLRANGIDPDLVPINQRLVLSTDMQRSFPRVDHDADMVLDVRLNQRGSDGHGVQLNATRTALVETQRTVPIRVAPPAIVREWLEARCPTCDR